MTKYLETILSQYCKEIGIAYTESMVNWEHPTKDKEAFADWDPHFFETVLNARTFQAPQPNLDLDEKVTSLPRDVQSAITDSLNYYRKMYEVRLKP